KGGGFKVRLKAVRSAIRRTEVTRKSSSGSGWVCDLMYSIHTSFHWSRCHCLQPDSPVPTGAGPSNVCASWQKQIEGTSPLKVLHRTRYRQAGWYRQQHMDMVPVDGPA